MPVDKLFGALNISASGLSAQRKKLDAISSNLANANTTRTDEGGPYRRKITVMKAQKTEGFQIVLNRSARKLAVTRPGHISTAPALSTAREEEVGVKAEMTVDNSDFRRVYDPNHPDADADGYVRMPNVNIVTEMVDMITASRSYEANLSAINTAKKMARAALDI